ncbi:MAG TPA: HEAT repeat domain-containing protein [Bryobacteraceae bacterium]|nr:HEAT repeat domain-containing protein [Bryobacteraceae bacterium]
MIPASIDAKTAELVREFSLDVNRFAESLRDWYQLFPESFYRMAAAEFRLDQDYFAFRLMAEDSGCCRFLCDILLLDQPAAKRLAQSLFTVASDLDIRLAQSAVGWAEEGTRQPMVRRCLLLLETLPPSSRVNTALVQLLRSNDGAVRSKVFQLLIRSSFNEKNIRAWLRDPDPRIRANVIECLARTRPVPAWAREVVPAFLNDPSSRTTANAAVLLFQTGSEADAINKLSQMARDEDPGARASAAWAMGEVGDSGFRGVLNELRADTDTCVRRHALKSLGRIRKVVRTSPAPATETNTPP